MNGCWAAGTPLYWESSCTSFSVQIEGSPRLGLNHDAVAPIAISAFARWPAAMCSDGFPSISVQDQGAVTCDRREYNPSGPNANVVTFVDANWPHDPGAIALTTVSFGLKTGKILDADMEVNSANFALNTQSLDYVLTHESGHFFGLDHSSDSGAIMNAYYSLPGPGAPAPVLSADDAQAICTTYPPLRVAAECRFEPADGFATDCGGDVTGGCTLAPAPRSTERQGGAGASAFALLALVFGFRRRRALKARRHSVGC